MYWFPDPLRFFKFFVYCMFIIVMMMTFNPCFDFCNSETSHFCFLCKQTRDSRSLFCFTRRDSSVWISHVFLWALVKCWNVNITVEYLSTSQKSMSFIMKLYSLQVNVFACFYLIRFRVRWKQVFSTTLSIYFSSPRLGDTIKTSCIMIQTVDIQICPILFP